MGRLTVYLSADDETWVRGEAQRRNKPLSALVAELVRAGRSEAEDAAPDASEVTEAELAELAALYNSLQPPTK